MGDFNLFNEIAATAGGAEDFANEVNFLANTRLQIRDVRLGFVDPGVGGGAAVFRLWFEDRTVAPAVRVNVWGMALESGAANPWVENAGDRHIYYETGAIPRTLGMSINAANAGATALFELSGRYEV